MLLELNAPYREHRDLRPSLAELAELAGGGYLPLMTDSGPFDVLGFVCGGRRYEDASEGATTMTVGDLNIKVLPLAALISEKKALGRDKDAVANEVLMPTNGGNRAFRQTSVACVPFAREAGFAPRMARAKSAVFGLICNLDILHWNCISRR